MSPDTATEQRLRGTRRSKSCNTCKVRKIRCSGFPAPCSPCKKRGSDCIFGYRKVPQRKNVNKDLLTVSQSPADVKGAIVLQTPEHPIAVVAAPSSSELQVQSRKPLPSDLYIDRLLARARSGDNIKEDQRLILKGNGLFGGVYTLTFFSDSRLASLSTKLQNDRVDQLVQRISGVIKSRLRSSDAVSVASFAQRNHRQDNVADQSTLTKYITVYFNRVHPLFPHLNRASFESAALSDDLPTILSERKAFSALYHAVLALGCLYDGGGSFEPGKGRAWDFFSISLGLFRDLSQQPDSLLILQAMTTMSIYSLTITCLGIERLVISEAAHRAHSLSLLNLTGSKAEAFKRTFWVLYSVEKMSSFYFGRASDINDANVTTPIPYIPESVFGSFDWFLSFSRLTRLLSRAITDLFSPGVHGKDTAYFLALINELNADLEVWRATVPEDVRPGAHQHIHSYRWPMEGPAVIWAHLLYYSFRLLLSRTYLQVASSSDAGISDVDRTANHDTMMDSSRFILQLMAFIDVEPSTPLWFLAGIPICALFIIFDEVLNCPQRDDSRTDLALLDMASGHFSRIEYASGGNLPTSLVAEFAHIARDYVNSMQNQAAENRALDVAASQMPLEVVKPQAPDIQDASVEDSLTAGDPSRMCWPETVGQNTDWLYGSMATTPNQDPWAQNNIFEGIDVMEIFNTFMPNVNF